MEVNVKLDHTEVAFLLALMSIARRTGLLLAEDPEVEKLFARFTSGFADGPMTLEEYQRMHALPE